MTFDWDDSTEVGEPLVGGNTTQVTRVGHTVRRAAGPWTPTISALLCTLREAGVVEVPEPLGVDRRGREVLGYLPGDVAHYPLPGWVWSEVVLHSAGELLRRIHDASRRFVYLNPVWRMPAHDPPEVICHNDFAPYNLVFREGRLAGVIDFDTASPGPRVWDVAYLAYRLVPFCGEAGESAPAETEWMARLDALVGAYGLPFPRRKVLETMVDRLDDLAAYTDRRALDTGQDAFHEHAAMYRRDSVRIAALAAG